MYSGRPQRCNKAQTGAFGGRPHDEAVCSPQAMGIPGYQVRGGGGAVNRAPKIWGGGEGLN